MDVLETTADARTSPFAGKSMNCRACHLVDESPDPGTTGTRTYADFARPQPDPADRGDGRTHTPRNSPPLVNASLARDGDFFLHYDGEFPSAEDLVVGTFTGRNFGWLPTSAPRPSRTSRASSAPTTAAMSSPRLLRPFVHDDPRRDVARNPGDLPPPRGAAPRRQRRQRRASCCAVPPGRRRVHARARLSAGRRWPVHRLALRSLSDPERTAAAARGRRDAVDYARRLRAALAALARAEAARQPCRARVRAPRSALRVRRGRTGRPARSSWPSPPPRRRRRTSSPPAVSATASPATRRRTSPTSASTTTASPRRITTASTARARSRRWRSRAWRSVRRRPRPSCRLPRCTRPAPARSSRSRRRRTRADGPRRLERAGKRRGSRAAGDAGGHPRPRDGRHRHGAAAAPRDRPLQDRGPARPRPVGAVLPHRAARPSCEAAVTPLPDDVGGGARVVGPQRRPRAVAHRDHRRTTSRP